MKDPRHAQLAKVLVRHSTQIKPGDHVLLEAFDVDPAFLQALVQEVCDAGGLPVMEYKFAQVTRKLLHNGTPERMKFIAKNELARMKQMDVYMGIRGMFNSKELSDVPPEKMTMYETLWAKPVHLQERVNNTRWVVLRMPSPQLGQMANMSTEAFEDFFYKVCADVDWAKAEKAVKPAVEFMKKADKVHIKGPGTDLKFSIKSIPVIPCCGHMNIPDLEVFTAPVKESVEGVVSYNAPSSYRGFTFKNIVLEFKKGKIVKATSNDNERINKIFDTDKGARYVGEFAMGFHPYIMQPMDDILFDEKICGSFHFTPGNSYDEADNTNKSSIHWDLVCMQRKENGGGEIWMDGELIRKDGIFVHKAFKAMNPDQLAMK
jgi:aminopeptidase